MNLERIYFKTEDNTELAGLLSTPNEFTDKVVISIHGMQSNCLKKREDILGREISKEKIAYFAFNNRGHELMAYVKKSNGQSRPDGGSSYEDVLDGYYDIKGAITKMQELGYKKIYLQGHSLGCTKIIYTYNRLLKERDNGILSSIRSIILLSLVDIVDTQRYDLGDEKSKEMLEYAESKEKEGRAYELMPKESMIHPISIKSYLRYYRDNEDINFARFSEKDYDFKEINNINVPLFMRWGNSNEIVIQDLDELVEILKSKIHNEKFDIGYINGADHGYGEREDALAREIINFLKNLEK